MKKLSGGNTVYIRQSKLPTPEARVLERKGDLNHAVRGEEPFRSVLVQHFLGDIRESGWQNAFDTTNRPTEALTRVCLNFRTSALPPTATRSTLPFLGIGVLGPIHFQCWLCAIPTSQTVIKAASLGESGGSGGSGSPSKTFVTASAEFEMDSRL